MRQGAPGDRATQDAAIAQALKVTGTPTFVIGRLEAGGTGGTMRPGGVLYGVVPVAQFEKAIRTLGAAGSR